MKVQLQLKFRNSLWARLAAVCALAASLAMAQAQQTSLRGRLADENGLPVQGAEFAAVASDGAKYVAHSDETGIFQIPALPPGDYQASITKSGFFLVQNETLNLREGANDISFTLSHEYEVHESVEVTGSAQQVEPEQIGHRESLELHEIVDMPLPKTHDLETYLPSLPGVVRDNAGQLHLAGGRGQETEYLLDGFEIGDPATGLLTAHLNVDAVRSIDADSGGFGAEFPHGGAGVMALNTQMGDDHLRFGATNFFPGISTQQGLNLGNWYPRFTLGGPIEKGRAWFSDAFSIQHTLSVISGLPKTANTITQWAGDNLMRAQFNFTPTHILQANFLANQVSDAHLGLSALSPLPTTTNLRSGRYFVSLKDQIAFEQGLLEIGVAVDTGSSQTVPQGTVPYVVTPFGTSGSYFETLRQRSRRWQTIEDVFLPSKQWHGTHDIRAGFNADNVAFSQQAFRNPIESRDASGTLSLLTTFSGPAQYRLTDSQAGGHAQDLWQPIRWLVVQLGGRMDWNGLIGQALVAPRLGANWIPFSDGRAKFNVNWGIYYQPPDLTLFGIAHDQTRIDSVYGPGSPQFDTPAGLQSPVTSRFTVPGGLAQPRFYTTSLGWQEKFGAATFLNIHGILRSERHGLAYEYLPNILPSGQPFGGEFRLGDNRRDSYRALEFSFRRTMGAAEFFADYTRSRARSNEALDYTLQNPLFAAQFPAALPWDAPNRLISYGWTPTKIWSLLASYYFEYRTGFPFGLATPAQQLIGPPDQLRFPAYVSLDLGIEKRFHFRQHEWAVRLVAVNVMDHQNPDVVSNIAGAPLQFFGGQGRAFTARLRLVGKK